MLQLQQQKKLTDLKEARRVRNRSQTRQSIDLRPVESEIKRIQVGALDSCSYLSAVKCAQEAAQKGNEQGERR